MKNVDLNYFPGFTRKCMSFSIDDGVLVYDKKFIDILAPAGFVGSFNLVSDRLTELTHEEYREFYKGHEIANHCKYHPLAMADGVEYQFSNLPFNSQTSSHDHLHSTGIIGLYHIWRPNGWRFVATDEAYKRFVTECQIELEAIFGEGNIHSYVWPFGLQKNEELQRWMTEQGFESIRCGVTTKFDMPEDRNHLYCVARETNILERAEAYDALADDGKLKFFLIGFHSIDFERAEKWGDLQEFAEKYGNRPSDFWYATPHQIFTMDDAIKAAVVTDSGIVNNSDITLYATVDGVRITIAPREEYKF